MVGGDGAEDGLTTAPREVHVEEHDIWVGGADDRNRILDRRCLADDLDTWLAGRGRCELRQFGSDAGAEQGVILDEDEPNGHRPPRGMRSSTSVPEPDLETTVAVPPARRTRPTIESAMPRRSSGTLVWSKPTPVSRT